MLTSLCRSVIRVAFVLLAWGGLTAALQAQPPGQISPYELELLRQAARISGGTKPGGIFAPGSNPSIGYNLLYGSGWNPYMGYGGTYYNPYGMGYVYGTYGGYGTGGGYYPYATTYGYGGGYYPYGTGYGYGGTYNPYGTGYGYGSTYNPYGTGYGYGGYQGTGSGYGYGTTYPPMGLDPALVQSMRNARPVPLWGISGVSP